VGSSARLRFRRATVEDVPSIVALVESAYRGDASRRGWTTEADLLDGQRTDAAAVTDLMSAAGSRFLLAEEQGRLVGSLLLAHEPPNAYIGMFAIRPDCQGREFGRQLLHEAERVARVEWTVGGIRMTVIAQRLELIAWYERRGYAQTGEREPFPYGQPRFGLPRRDDLYFVTLFKALR
jgi:ribosomal protein S18 acetylase RimI-like enzyme